MVRVTSSVLVYICMGNHPVKLYWPQQLLVATPSLYFSFKKNKFNTRGRAIHQLGLWIMHVCSSGKRCVCARRHRHQCCTDNIKHTFDLLVSASSNMLCYLSTINQSWPGSSRLSGKWRSVIAQKNVPRTAVSARYANGNKEGRYVGALHCAYNGSANGTATHRREAHRTNAEQTIPVADLTTELLVRRLSCVRLLCLSAFLTEATSMYKHKERKCAEF